MNDNGKTAREARGAYDLVAIDVDGTLLNSKSELSDGAEAAVKAVRNRGIGVTLVSGRGKLPLTPLLHRLGIELPYIGSGGAYIADPLSGHVIEHNPLTREDVAMVVELGRAAQMGIFFEEVDRLTGEASPEVMRFIRAIAGVDVAVATDILRETRAAPTKMFLTGDHNRLVKVETQIRQSNRPLNLVFSEPIYLEVTRSGINKGAAVRRLAEYLNLPLQRIAVIGDGGNDISMFRIAGLSVAMGNAGPDVKAAANFVAPTNDEGGVAWALRELILKA